MREPTRHGRKPQRAQRIRAPIRKAVLQAEYNAIRAAYHAKPDSEAEADDWSTAEEYKPGHNMRSGG